MSQLIYTSRETQEFSPADLSKLLVRARRRNSAMGLTGMLIYQDGTFLQALEGGEAAVSEIFCRIEKDPRHGDLHVLHRSALLLGPRAFGESPMGFADAAGVAQILRGFLKIHKHASLSALDTASAIDMLEACGREIRAQSA